MLTTIMGIALSLSPVAIETTENNYTVPSQEINTKNDTINIDRNRVEKIIESILKIFHEPKVRV